jgi:hypothetical protein
MKKISTAGRKEIRKFSQQELTIGLDLRDRSSWYCVLEESGRMVVEQKVSTTGKHWRCSGPCHAAGLRWKPGCIRRG